MKFLNYALNDRSSFSLILANLFTIAFAVISGWDLNEVMLIYWGQSVVIGYYNYRRIRALKEYSTKNFRMNNRSVPANESTKKSVARFFALHFGIFHIAYLLVLAQSVANLSTLQWLSIAICLAFFIFNHRYSFAYNLEADLNRKPNIGTLMFFPYARIIPMHLTILIGASLTESKLALAVFLALKTLADLMMHLVEHYSNVEAYSEEIGTP